MTNFRLSINGTGLQGARGPQGNVPDTFNVKDSAYGAKGDGTTDDYAAVMAAITAAYNNGGGTVYFPAGTYRIDTAIVIPNDNAATGLHKQPPITLRGSGDRVNPILTATSSLGQGGTILDLRATTGTAKIATYGSGQLSVERLMMLETGSSAVPFLYTTLTQLRVHRVSFCGNKVGLLCDQDAIILGGNSGAVDNTTNSNFAGYGSSITHSNFSRIRRGVYLRAGANSNIIDTCYWDYQCGADTTAAAVEFDGTGDQCTGNVLTNSFIEVPNYAYGCKLTTSNTNTISNTQFWDGGANWIYAIYVDSTAYGTTVRDAYAGGNAAKYTNNMSKLYGSVGGLSLTSIFTGGDGATLVRPLSPSADTAVQFGIYRSLTDGTNPNGEVFSVRQNGAVNMTANSATSNTRLYINNSYNSAGTLLIDHTQIQRSAGVLDLYAGTGTNDQVRIRRGVLSLASIAKASRPSAGAVNNAAMYWDTTDSRLRYSNGSVWSDTTKLQSFTTAGRPAANATDWGVGSCYFDTTLNKPVWSDGTNWRDASGTTV